MTLTIVDINKINGQTRISELIKAFPNLKVELPAIDHKFEALYTPFFSELVKLSTVEQMAEKVGMDSKVLVKKIKRAINEN